MTASDLDLDVAEDVHSPGEDASDEISFRRLRGQIKTSDVPKWGVKGGWVGTKGLQGDGSAHQY